MQPPRQNSWIAEASRILGVPLKRHTQDKAVGPCPYCRDGVDRFIVWNAGNAWCNHCHQTCWWLPRDEVVEKVVSLKIAKAEQQQKLLGQMSTCYDWIAYNKNLEGEKIGQWYEHGIADSDIEKWGLGLCSYCPSCPDYASLTIPVFREQKLVDIRHRLIGAENGDKYRSHVAGLVPTIFNIDSVDSDKTVVIVEGEKKAILSVRAGFTATLGLPGAQFAKRLEPIVAKLDKTQQVVLALDPDQVQNAEALALLLTEASENVRVADFSMKPDDFLLRYGDKAYAAVIKQARKIRPANRNGHGS